MEHFYIYSFTLAVIPLLLGLLFIWFGKKLWDNATKKNEEYQQRYTGRTTLRVIKVEKTEFCYLLYSGLRIYGKWAAI